MFRYLYSELYRTIKTHYYSLFILFSAICMAIIVIFVRVVGMDLELYFNIMKGFATIGILLVSTIVALIVYKPKSIKTLILSSGKRKIDLYILDIITMQALVSITAMTLISISFVGAHLAYGSELIHLYSEYGRFTLNMIVLSLNITSGVVGLIYLTNNVSLGVLSQYIMIPVLYLVMRSTGVNTRYLQIIDYIGNIQSYTLLQNLVDEPALRPSLHLMLTSGAFSIVFYLIPGYLMFRRREIY